MRSAVLGGQFVYHAVPLCVRHLCPEAGWDALARGRAVLLHGHAHRRQPHRRFGSVGPLPGPGAVDFLGRDYPHRQAGYPSSRRRGQHFATPSGRGRAHLIGGIAFTCKTLRRGSVPAQGFYTSGLFQVLRTAIHVRSAIHIRAAPSTMTPGSINKTDRSWGRYRSIPDSSECMAR